MADDTVLISQQHTQPIRIAKWTVSIGGAVSIGRVILLYDFADVGKQTQQQRKLKSAQAGTVHELIAPEGAIVRHGEPLLRLNACIHPTVMKDMCAECGADLRRTDESSVTASVPMVHAIPELKVSAELAQKLGRADSERLLRDRKLVLLVDLDQTLIHTTNDNIPPNIKDVYHFQLYGANSPWYHTRLRPGTHAFLKHIFELFELHICTFGARNYAHMIATFLDTDQSFFGNRILSRDECFDPTSKTANLRALFPCGDDMVCIIDDREDVWSHATNLIHVKPYHFFKHTGDINAPPGLDKQEADDTHHGLDFDDMKTTNGSPMKNGSKDVPEEEESSTNNEEKHSMAKAAQEQTKCKMKDGDEELIEVEDADDYLLYLEDILRMVHRRFYEQFDKLEAGSVPDLKLVIPTVRGEVLKGKRLVFSGLVPTHIKLEESKAYQVARSLGAVVTQDIDETSTHLVAVRPGTVKVNAGRRRKHLKIVTPDWLWACAERWEFIDEAMYPLNSKGSKNRHPPPHCSSPEHAPTYPVHEQPAVRKRTPSGRFMDTINPLMSFSRDDIADMDKEVEDILDDESEESSSVDSASNEPRGHKRMRDDIPPEAIEEKLEEDEEEEKDSDSTLDGYPSTKLQRANVEDSEDEEEDVGQDESSDDGEWNMMGAALEREFLSNNEN